jgi:hypothetical protein
MKRFAAHYIFYPAGKPRKLHYIELDDQNCVRTVEPLNAEIAATAFYSGIIIVTNTDVPENARGLNKIRLNPDKPVKLYLLSGTDLSATELSAGDGCSHCHIQRLC